MSEHIYNKEEIIEKLEGILNKTLEEIDNKGIFNHILNNNITKQKGIAGTIIEQCVMDYPPDTKQKPDITVIDGGKSIPTELKVTGMSMDKKTGKQYVAKETISITAVGVYTLAEQTFETSHFWAKLEHLLLVYYLYESNKANKSVTAYEYKDFHVKGYEFHEFNDSDKETLKKDWTYVHDFVANVVRNHNNTTKNSKEWKEAVKKEYVGKHSALRDVLSYINLAPEFPPRFRLKQSVVNAIISNYFGYALEQLPGKYTTVSEIDKKCEELERLYKGKTIAELAEQFNIPLVENKAIAEQIVIKMFGGNSKKLNQIELFAKFGLIAKSITVTPNGTRTEDMKLFHIDFDEMMTETIVDDDTGEIRPFQFEDSELYMYFADHEFLCIVYEEPEKEYIKKDGKRVEQKHSLSLNKFVGFQRIVFSEEFLNEDVRKVWEDTRNKIKNNLLKDVPVIRKDGTPVTIGNGEVSSAPNFIKCVENPVFIRGGGIDSSSEHKTECVNGIKMLPQFIWIKGKAICQMLTKLNKPKKKK